MSEWFNDDQVGHMDSLARIPREDRCPSGWHILPGTGHPMAQECDCADAEADERIVKAVLAESARLNRIAAVFVFPNGNVAVTNEDGNQITRLQGRWEEMRTAILAEARGRERDIEWFGYGP